MTKTQLLKSAQIISFPVLVCSDPLLKLLPLLRKGGTLYFFSSLFSFSHLLALSGCDIVFLLREREKERWRCWDMALKVNEVCRFCFCFPVCVCVILELAWADLARIYGSVAFVILIIYISWSVRAYRSAQSIGWLKKSVVQGYTGIDLGWLSELGLYISMFLCL